MKIIYHCYGGAHSSVTAAAIHLGLLPTNRLPTAADLEGLPFYDRAVRADHGRMRLMGVDADGHEVYVLGRRFMPVIAERVVRGVAEVYGKDPGDLLMVNALTSVNLTMKFGGFVSRGMLLPYVGRPVVERGTAGAVRRLLSIVEAAKRRAAARPPSPGGMNPSRSEGDGPPKVFYHCYGSAHSSIVAAALHLGMLPEDRVAENDEIAGLTFYDRVDRHELGVPAYIGRDVAGCEVYAIGLAGGKDLLTRMMRSVLDLFGLPQEGMILRDSLVHIGAWTKAGGVLSRRMGLVGVGRPLTIFGLRRNYSRLAELARQTRTEAWGRRPPRA
ncbi:MAG: DUF3189 family protein [Bacillota bacterium]